jgi:NADH-quinone oxidoreductase subunit M
MLTILLVIPLAGAAALLLVDRANTGRINQVAMATTGALAVLSVFLAANFDPAVTDGVKERFDYLQSAEWIPTLGVTYSVGIDGISLVLLLLTCFLAPWVTLASQSAIGERRRDFFFWMLILHAAMIGTLISRDAFMFFLFWELMLVPMALIIGIWGSERRIYASVKFVLYTVVGSLPMLAALVYLVVRHKAVHGAYSCAIDDLATLGLSTTEQIWCFAAFALSFIIKVPLWPLHTWLPDAHTEAPTPGSVILAGVLLKMGGYGLIRFCLPLFPEGARFFAPALSVLALVAIIAGSLVAMVQADVKRLVAYSSVAHMGAVILGIFSLTPEGMAGAVFMMLAHGLSTGLLFILVGFIYERRHTREFSEYGGIAKVMPLFAIVFVFATLASIGLPGLNGFPGEFLILLGAFKANPLYAVFGVTGVILGAWYMLAAVKRVFFGEITNEKNRSLVDLSAREIVICVPIMIGILWMGVRPETFMSAYRSEVSADAARVEMVEGQ